MQLGQRRFDCWQAIKGFSQRIHSPLFLVRSLHQAHLSLEGAYETMFIATLEWLGRPPTLQFKYFPEDSLLQFNYYTHTIMFYGKVSFKRLLDARPPPRAS